VALGVVVIARPAHCVRGIVALGVVVIARPAHGVRGIVALGVEVMRRSLGRAGPRASRTSSPAAHAPWVR